MQTNPHVMPETARAAADASIRAAGAADAQDCFAVLTLAFEIDPPSRWIWPERRQYLDAFPRFAEAFGGPAVDLGTADCRNDLAGCALWLPPGAMPDGDGLVEIFNDTISDDRREAMFDIFAQMDLYHPGEPHWHLPLIGVDPARQGAGIGSALLRRVLERCDRDQLPAYLEATSPRNILLYARHGFEAIGCIQVSDCPPIVPMLREPQ